MSEVKINTELLGVPLDQLRVIDLSGAEIVRRQYLSHLRDPQVTIRPDGIQFNNTAIQMLEDAVYVYIIMDRKLKWLVVEKVDPDVRDCQRWCSVKDGVKKSRKITGADYADRAYRMMGWNKGYYYKVCGTPALSALKKGVVHIIFELENYDRYCLTEKARKTAGVLDSEIGEEELENIKTETEAVKKAKEEAAANGTRSHRKKYKHPDNWDSESFGEPYTLHKDRLELPKLKPNEDQPTIGNAVDKQETI